MGDRVYFRAHFEDLGIDGCLARNAAGAGNLAQREIEVDEPIVFPFIVRRAKELHGDAVPARETNADVPPDIADLPLQDLRGDPEITFQRADRIHVSSSWVNYFRSG